MTMHKYVIVENRHTGQEAIKLLEEPFAGIVYSYGTIETTEDEVNRKITLRFGYDIIDKANKDFGSMEPFEKYIGEILTEILHQKIKEMNDE